MKKKITIFFGLSIISLLLSACSTTGQKSATKKLESATKKVSSSEVMRKLPKYQNLTQTTRGEIFFPAHFALDGKDSDSIPLVTLNFVSAQYLGESVPESGDTAGKEAEVFMVTLRWKWTDYEGKKAPEVASFTDVLDGAKVATLTETVNDQEAKYTTIYEFSDSAKQQITAAGYKDPSTEGIKINSDEQTVTMMFSIEKSKLVTNDLHLNITFHDIKKNSLAGNFDLTLDSQTPVTPH